MPDDPAKALGRRKTQGNSHSREATLRWGQGGAGGAGNPGEHRGLGKPGGGAAPLPLLPASAHAHAAGRRSLSAQV